MYEKENLIISLLLQQPQSAPILEALALASQYINPPSPLPKITSSLQQQSLFTSTSTFCFPKVSLTHLLYILFDLFNILILNLPLSVAQDVCDIAKKKFLIVITNEFFFFFLVVGTGVKIIREDEQARRLELQVMQPLELPKKGLMPTLRRAKSR